jgi:hypothetical protein
MQLLRMRPHPRSARLAATIVLGFVTQLSFALSPILSTQALDMLSTDSTGAATTTGTSFLIGLSRDSSQNLSPVLINQLAQSLAQRPLVREALPAAGYSGIQVIVSDTEFDLVQRMNQNALGVAFCSSVAFVTQVGAYEAMFQWRGPGDEYDPSTGRIVHRGVVLAGMRSPLFRDGVTSDSVARAIDRAEVAFPTSFHAAAFVEPTLALQSMTGGRLPRPLFLGSSDEVAMNVINGSVELGAVETSALARVLGERGFATDASALFQVVLTTPPVPTDPVVIQIRHNPRDSVLGRELRVGIRQFFAQIPGQSRLQNATSQAYDGVRQSVLRLRER